MVNRIQGSGELLAGAGFDFHKCEGVSVSCDDIDFSSFWSAEIPIKDTATLRPEIGAGDFFSE
jgi:hypothetical protein